MNFGEKLELLMNMTNTTNNEIASNLDIDPSLISRFRTGKRVPRSISGYRQRIAKFIASKATQEYQKVALMELTDTFIDDSEDEQEFLTSIITTYLEDSSLISQKEISHFISTVSKYQEPVIPSVQINRPEIILGEQCNQELFIGPAGLRAAVIKLLNTALEEPEGSVLRLFSEEEMTWITEDPQFSHLWTSMLTQCIKKGIQIEIIHTLQRNSNELNTALVKWFPFYLSGAISSYFIPVKYDKLFNHTLFLINNSYGVHAHSPAHQERKDRIYYADSQQSSVSHLTSSFSSLLENAKPLVLPYKEPTVETYFDVLSHSFEQGTNRAFGLESFFSLSMNESLLKKILTRVNVEPNLMNRVIDMQKRVNEIVSSYLNDKELTLITTLPRVTEILKGKKKCVIPPLGRPMEIHYRPSEFKEHLEYIVTMLRKHSNLNIFIIPHQRFSFGVQAITIDENSLLVLKQTRPTLLFKSEQKELVTSMKNYIQNIAGTIPKRHKKKEYIISRFTQLIGKIERGLSS